MGIEEDSLRALRELNQNIASLTRSLGQMGGQQSFGHRTTPSGRPRQTPASSLFDDDDDISLRRGTIAFKSAKRAAKGYDQAAKRFLRVSGDLSNEVADANEDLAALRTSWSEGADSMHHMTERIDKFGTSAAALNNQATLIVAGMGRFTDELAKNTKAQSLLHAEHLTLINNFKEFERAAYFDELGKAVGGLQNLSKATKDKLKVFDKATGNLRTDLGVEDFKRLRSTIGEVESSMKEVLSQTGFKSFGDLFNARQFNVSPGDHLSPEEATRAAMGQDGASINRDAVARMAAMLQERGLFHPQNEAHNVLDANGQMRGNLENIDWEGLAQEIANLESTFGNTAHNIDRNTQLFQTALGRFIGSMNNAAGQFSAMDSIKKMVTDFLSSTAAFKFAARKIKEMWEEISDFNIAQIPASYLQVNKASVALGLSFKETVALMDENKRMLAIYGPEKFQAAMGMMQKTFQKYGYTMKQAAETIGPTVESAISAGINIRDPGELNKYADTMMDQFQKVSGMVKISAQEFAALNKTLFQSDGAFGIMLGMDTQRRNMYAQELVQLRTKYVAQGLEIQQAQELVKAQQEQQRGRLAERTGDAAKLMQQAMLAGMGSDQAMEVYRLASKGRRSKDEQARFTELTGQIGQEFEKRTNEGYGASGNGAMGDIYNELRQDLQPSGQTQQIQRSGEQIQMAKEAGAQVNPDEQKKASEAAKGNESVAVLGQAINQVSSVINNAFLGAIVGSTAALVAFAFQLSRTSLLMGGPGGLLSALKNIGSGGLNAARTGASTAANAVRGAASSTWGAVRGAAPRVAGAVEGAAGSVMNAGRTAVGAVRGAATGVAEAAPGALRGASSAAGSLIKGGAGILGKAAGPLAGIIAAYQAWGDIDDAEEQRKKGEITDKQATVKKTGAVTGAAGGVAASLAGAAIGQVLIPIPGVGALIGGAVGGALGSWLGKTGGEAIADAVVSDKKPDAQQASTPAPTPTPAQSKPDAQQASPKKDMTPAQLGQAVGQMINPQKDDKSTVAKPTSDDKPANPIVDGINQATPTLATAIADAIKAVFVEAGVIQAKATGKQSDALKSLATTMTSTSSLNPLATTMGDLSTTIKTATDASTSTPLLDSISPFASTMATPLNTSVQPIAPPTQQIQTVDSATDALTKGINTLTQDGENLLDVKDEAALAQLQSIATNMAQAVAFLQSLVDQKPSANTSATAAPPPNNMNQIPTAFQFTTGRTNT
jgi:hypothetical protein